jgi:phage gp29-like protein
MRHLKPGTSIFSTASRRYLRSVRSTMLRSLSGETLAAALDGFETGNLRAAASLWQSMVERDDVLACVKPKREKAVSRRDWQVLTTDDSQAAKQQQKILTEFWNNVKAVDAMDANRRGGFSMLVRQMMQAVSFRYQVHHLVWQPSSDMLRCTFESVPLTFFENLTGRLQFCASGLEYEGKPMAEDEWMVSWGDGLMLAGSIAYFCKRNALADWMAFSDKFGMPGILGKTNQGQDTDGGRAMADAVESFCQDWAAVIYGDEGSGKIELVTAQGNANSMPMPALIERVDRRMTALYRGADLSTFSSSQGTGASVQDGESDLIEQDDALMISERLNEIEEIVLRWWFGPRVKIKAYIRLIVPQSEDLKLLLEAVEKLVKLGAPIAVADILERFGFATPKQGAELLHGDCKCNAPGQPGAQGILSQLNADAAEEQFLADATRLLSKASRQDRENLVGELKDVLSAPDGQLISRLAAFMEALPGNIGKDSAQVRAWERLLISALVNGWGSSAPASSTES